VYRHRQVGKKKKFILFLLLALTELALSFFCPIKDQTATVSMSRMLIRKSFSDQRCPILRRYSSSCGKILYEVYSDLMLPIPDELQQYDADKPGDDSVFAPGSANDVPSLGPFSALSSIGSRGSTESPDLNKYDIIVSFVACLPQRW